MTEEIFRVEAPDRIFVHDSRSALWREFAIRLALIGVYVAGALFFAIFVRAILLDIAAGTASRRDFGFLFWASCSVLLLAGLSLHMAYRQVWLARRLFDPPADLKLTPSGLEDRWIGTGNIDWKFIRYIEPAIGRHGLQIKAHIKDGWFNTVPDINWMRIGGSSSPFLSPTYGPAGCGNLFDVLYALARFVPVAGLPHDYRPSIPALKALDIPLQNRVYIPEPENYGDKTKIEQASYTLYSGQRVKLYFLVLFSIGLGWFGTHMAYLSVSLQNLSQSSYLVFLFSPAFILLGLWMLRAGLAFGPMLQLDSRGIRLKGYRAYGIIPWASIVAMRWHHRVSANFRSVAVDDFEFVVADMAMRQRRLPWYWRWLYRCRQFGCSTLKLRIYGQKNSQAIKEAMQAAEYWRYNAWVASAKYWFATWSGQTGEYRG